MTLRIGWVNHVAARYACEHWHYTQKIPQQKIARLGVWEDGRFIGVVLFGVGASANLHKSFGVSRYEICELVRVALTNHVTPVSRIIAVSLKLLRKENPGLKLVVSFADPSQGHHGGIYQAGGWIYTGMSAPQVEAWFNGAWRHVTYARRRAGAELFATLPKRPVSGKFRYVKVFNADLGRELMGRSRPYPKRVDLNGLEPHSAPEALKLKRSRREEKAVQVRPRRSKQRRT